jgi:hypothetical protein
MLQAYVSSVSVVFQAYVSSVLSGYCRSISECCIACMFQVFQVFHTYVASVSSVCYKSRSECCICCYGYIHMFQAYVSSVSFVFSRMLQVFQLDVSELDLGEHMLQWPQWPRDSGLPQPSVTVAGAAAWVTMWAPEASKCLCDAHPQAG